MIPSIEKTEINELMDTLAIQHKDCFYLFNPIGLTAVYQLYDNGFSYSVKRNNLIDFYKYLNFIHMNKNSKHLTPIEFNDFVKQISVLQEQSHTIKPLVSFEDYINILLNKTGLKLK